MLHWLDNRHTIQTLKLTSFLLGIAWLALVTVLLCLPGSTIPNSPFLEMIHADKWVHIFLFGILFLAFAWPLRLQDRPRKDKWLILIAIAGISYGAIMEFVQGRWVPNRSFELADIVADSTGCALGWLVARKVWGGGQKIGPDRNRDRNQN
jgi:VanZ family protein